MIHILGIMNYLLILIYGVVLSFLFVGIENTKINRRTFIYVILLLFSLQFTFWLFLGYGNSAKIYPFLIHIPNVLIITLYFKRRTSIAVVSVLCAYLCCQLPKWFATLSLDLFNSRTLYFIVNSFTILPMFYLVKRYVVVSVNQLMNMSRRALLLFGFVPLLYYLFDYITTTYIGLLYQGSEIAIIFMPSLVSMLYFVFIIFYYNEIKCRNDAENETILLSVQMKQTQKELDSFWELQEKDSIYRHDMRHHLNLIGGLLTDSDPKKAIDYIACTRSIMEEVSTTSYCEHNVVNIVLSHFAAKAKQDGIVFLTDVQIPEYILVSDTELCAILSNGLENAMQACIDVMEDRLKKIHINCKVHKDNLLILLENSYNSEIKIEKGIHSINKKEHGFGIRSMMMIINKYNGYYSYTKESGIYTLKIVLPLT